MQTCYAHLGICYLNYIPTPLNSQCNESGRLACYGSKIISETMNSTNNTLQQKYLTQKKALLYAVKK